MQSHPQGSHLIVHGQHGRMASLQALAHVVAMETHAKETHARAAASASSFTILMYS